MSRHGRAPSPAAGGPFLSGLFSRRFWLLGLLLVTSSVLVGCGDSPTGGGPPPAAPPPPPPPPPTQTIRVEADIDGRSQLILRRNTAQWHHLNAAAPGRVFDANKPTIIDGVEWFPEWPDEPDAENRGCDCLSDVFAGVDPALPDSEVSVNLNLIQSRVSTSIVQLPGEANDFTLIVEFDDIGASASATYIVLIELRE